MIDLTGQQLTVFTALIVVIDLTDRGGEKLKWISNRLLHEQPTYADYDLKKLKVDNFNPNNINSYITMTVADEDGHISNLVEAYDDFLGAKVQISYIISSPTQGEISNDTIRSYRIVVKKNHTKNYLSFDISNGLNGKGYRLGRSAFTSYCDFKFKGEFCKYAGSDSECKHTAKDCKQKGNLSNFGGFLNGKG